MVTRPKLTDAQQTLEVLAYTAELPPEISYQELLNVEENLAILEINVDKVNPATIENVGQRLFEVSERIEYNKVAIEKECETECIKLKTKFISDITFLAVFGTKKREEVLALAAELLKSEEDIGYVDSIYELFSEQDITRILHEFEGLQLVIELYRKWRSNHVVFEAIPEHLSQSYALSRNEVIGICGQEDSTTDTELVSTVYSSVDTLFKSIPKRFGKELKDLRFIRNPHIIIQINRRDGIRIAITPDFLITDGETCLFYFNETYNEAEDHLKPLKYPCLVPSTRFLLLYRTLLAHFAEKQFLHDGLHHYNKPGEPVIIQTSITWDDISQFIADVSVYDSRKQNGFQTQVATLVPSNNGRNSNRFHPGVATFFDLQRATQKLFQAPLIGYFRQTQPLGERTQEHIREQMLITKDRLKKLLKFAKLNPALRIRYKKGFIKPYAAGDLRDQGMVQGKLF